MAEQSAGDTSNPSKILVVEDDALVAMDIEATLSHHGFEVVGPVATVQQALVLINTSQRLDAAVLDFNLNGETVIPVAERLNAMSVPLVLVSGQPEADLRNFAPLSNASFVRKPFDEAALLHTLGCRA